VRTASDAGSPVRLIEATVQVNDDRKKAMAGKVSAALDGDLVGKTVGVLGLTFKPNTDDMRDAPSLDIIPALQALGATITAYDPEGEREARHLLKDVAFAAEPYAVASGAEAVVIITEWDQFRALDLDRLKTTMKAPVLVDLRNIYRPDDVRRQGFDYVSIGRG
jgi:UDPglucose 6-dehydrogenase